ncbi:sugar phosphate isomerase/epimerase family protein [Shinella sp.]|uniref:sugar phosphate isomerase/epimerase family protein n=1 Tax=Shinella sp. TaxID=1870904 RepID=UPI003F72AE55
MKIGLNTDGFGALPLEECLDRVAELGLTNVEFGLGGWSSAPHVDIADLLASAASRDRLQGMLKERNLEISALNCSGNQLHPTGIGANDTKLAYDTLELASLLGVERIVMMSGLPAGGPEDKNPNWITSSWPLEAMEILEWQWSERVLPFWKPFAKAAKQKGRRICVEQHGRQCIYNVESFFRLREAVGPTVGVNFDPSHLIWMGGDPISAIEALGACIYHVHGKDSRIELRARVDGLLDPKHVTPVEGRAWNFVSLGHGTAVHGWLDIVKSLRKIGYDDVISIENEDYSMPGHEAIATSATTLRFCIEQSEKSS